MRPRPRKALRLSTLRRAAVVASLAALAVIFVSAGSAKPPPAPVGTYQLCVSATGTACTPTGSGGDYSVLSGNNPELSLTVTNNAASNQTLDYVNFPLPSNAGLSIDTADSSQLVSYATYGASSTSSVLQLRNLALAPNHSATVDFFVNSAAPSCTDGAWGSAVVQSSSTGSAFVFTSMTGSSGLTSLVAKSCALMFQHEPAPALPTKTITDVAYTDSVGNGVDNVTVVPATVLPVPLKGGTVSLAQNSGAFDASGSSFSGTSVAFSNDGSATFASFVALKASGTGGPFTLRASADGFSFVDSAPPFAITKNGTPCNPNSSCPQLIGTDANGNTLTSITTGTGFSFVGTTPSSVPLDAKGNPPAGCLNWKTSSNTITGFVEFDGRQPGGPMTITYYVSQKAIKAKYGTNAGQQFLPICFGAKQIDSTTHLPVDCTPGTTGWLGDALNTSGQFTGAPALSMCGPDGYYWGILGSYQDKFITANDPIVTGWNGQSNIGQNYRSFDILLPPGWDARGGC